ncbi:plasmid replication protein [Salmonella enterica]|nr:plasmid replication protein [Salmonella enterica]EDR5596991.1 plasmid replication protein [Salmonella enterica subsp. diarizonae]EDU6311763.1 plasmid replication protein [Salmonella enterica subsp. diarizonae serovar 53:z10:z]EBK3635559.1 plasmid replication protein [Salmonella enterica]EGW0493049.1 plasmid replication protein [Salmonella enterica]
MIINGKKIKAKDLAKAARVSRSTVIKYYGIPREDYLKEAAEKRRLAFHLRSSGLKWKDVAEKMNTTEYSAIAYYRRYLALQNQ